MPKRQKLPKSFGEDCPHCGIYVPTAYYSQHMARCTQNDVAQPRNEQSSQSQQNHGQTPASYPLAQVDGQPPARLTNDGYPIDRCWTCRRRICLVPAKPAPIAYDIRHDNFVAEKHYCDGDLRETGRVRALTYVDKRLAAVAPNEKEKKRR